ncbi:hypothetical protein GF380_01180, partial [Candidatus Uhrbacteria bacterium]|nr:hypothetical protein [Candidatus Uhrbacteria bacterium]
MQTHDVANIFPMMTPDEFESLKADIQANGQREPIWTYQGQIIDGRNRHKACEELGIRPEVKEWNGQGSLVAFVVSLNLHRRHLTPMQKAAVAVDMLPMLEAEAKERQLRTAENREKAEKEKNLVVEKIPQQDSDSEFERLHDAVHDALVVAALEDHAKKEQENKSREQAAQLVGTNARYVSDMKRYKEESPAVYEAAKSGKVNGSQAKVLNKLSPEKCKAVLDRLQKEEMSAKEIKKTVKR